LFVDYDLSLIPYTTNSYSTLIRATSFLYIDYDNSEGYVSYWNKFYQPNLNTYYPINMLLPTTDNKYDENWMSYELEINYPQALSGAFYDYEHFNIVLEISDIINNNEINTDSTYSKTSIWNDGTITVEYKPIYND